MNSISNKKHTYLQIIALKSVQLCFIIAACLGAAAIASNALAAHLPAYYFSTIEGRAHLYIAANMALLHSILLITLCLNSAALPLKRTAFICLMMLIGIICFSLSVALHALGIITHALLAPFGGIMLIVSWLSLISLLPSLMRKITSHLSNQKNS